MVHRTTHSHNAKAFALKASRDDDHGHGAISPEISWPAEGTGKRQLNTTPLVITLPLSPPGFSRPTRTPVLEHVHKCPALIAPARDCKPPWKPHRQLFKFTQYFQTNGCLCDQSTPRHLPGSCQQLTFVIEGGLGCTCRKKGRRGVSGGGG